MQPELNLPNPGAEMALEQEIKKARVTIKTDGYDMSLGELMSLYRNQELVINPEFQRYFRWEESQKTRFVESLLLGIPIPPIFVFQRDDGIWELVDGLQRLSTMLEFTGLLRKPDGSRHEPSVLEGTKYLPSLSGKRWERQEGDREDAAFSPAQQLEIKRSRMRVEILKKGSDPYTKYELFQRLNTGGSSLSEQEVRNCVMVMVDRTFYQWIVELSHFPAFEETISQTQYAEKRQKDVELALRFVVFRNREYESGLDIHEFLDHNMIDLAMDDELDRSNEKAVFERTFSLLFDALGEGVFKRYDGDKFVGQFLISAFEFIAIGVAKNLDRIEALGREESKAYLRERVPEVWRDETFRQHSGAGVRGTTRVGKLIPRGIEFFSV